MCGIDILLIFSFKSAQQHTLIISTVSESISLFKVMSMAFETVRQNSTMHRSKFMSLPITRCPPSTELSPSVSRIINLGLFEDFWSDCLMFLIAILIPWVHLPLLFINLVLNMWLNRKDLPTLCFPIWDIITNLELDPYRSPTSYLSSSS